MSVFFSWGVFLAFLWPRLFFRDSRGIWAGWRTLWADFSLHVNCASIFAYRDPSTWFSFHPTFISERFNYPFVVDMISGLLMRFGVDIVPAFVVPSIVLTFIFLAFVFVFYFTVFESSKRSFLALSIFLTSGGLGFLIFLDDLWKEPSLSTLVFPPHEYTAFEPMNIRWMNIVTTQVLPQRSFLLGFPIALFILYLFDLWCRTGLERASTLKIVGLGLLTSSLYAIHSASLMALGMIFGVLFFFHSKAIRFWLIYGFSVLLPSFLFHAYFFKTALVPSFFAFKLGWMAPPSFFGILKFWWFNYGLFLPMAIFGIWKARLLRNPYVIAGILMFVLCNLARVSPWDWNNTKILVWSHFFLTIPVVYALSFFWGKKFLEKVAAVFVSVILMASGGLDIYRLTQWKRLSNLMWSSQDEDYARDFRALSKADDIVLVAPNDFQSWVTRLTGRPIVLGYTAHLWTYGFDYHETEQDVRTMFRGGEEAERLFQKYKVRYVVIGRSEKQDYGANEAYFLTRHRQIMEAQDRRVYEISDRSVNGTR
jgi:hypothetical protein